MPVNQADKVTGHIFFDWRHGHHSNTTTMCLLRKLRGLASEINCVPSETFRFPITSFSRLLYQYKVTSHLATGSSGDIYIAKKNECGTVMAVKVCPTIQAQEAFTLINLRDHDSPIGIPKIFGYGYHDVDSRTFIAMELLGASISDVLSSMSHGLPLKTVCMLAIRVLSSLEYIHSQGYIHGDINPGNICIGKDHPEMIYLIDYENSSRYRNSSQKHVLQTNGRPNKGNFCYASVNAHDGLQLSRKDDLISLTYTLVRLATGSLPWEKNSFELVGRFDVVRLKKATSRDSLCKGLPSQFKLFCKDVEQLAFDEDPLYHSLISLFKGCIEDLGEVDDAQFSWIKSKVPKSGE